MPFVLAIPIIAVVMKRMFQFSGPVNEVLRWLSLDFLALDWIGSSDVALWTVMILIIWRESALGIILFLARLLSLDESLIEAAKLDGASWWQRVWYVILPQMRGVIEFYVVVSVITMLSAVFAYVYIMGGGRGGPGTSTMVVELYIFNALDPHQPAGHRLGRLGDAVPRVAAADRAAVRGAPPRQREQEREPTAPSCSDRATLRRRATRSSMRVLLFASFLALVPTIFMISTALKSDEEYAVNKLGLPDMPVLDHFRAVLFDSPFFRWMANSLILVAGAVAAQHRRVVPRRLRHRADAVPRPRDAACRSARR